MTADSPEPRANREAASAVPIDANRPAASAEDAEFRRQVFRCGITLTGVGFGLSMVGSAVMGTMPTLQGQWPEAVRMVGLLVALAGLAALLFHARQDWLLRNNRKSNARLWWNSLWQYAWGFVTRHRRVSLLVCLAMLETLTFFTTQGFFTVRFISCYMLGIAILCTRGRYQAFCAGTLAGALFMIQESLWMSTLILPWGAGGFAILVWLLLRDRE